MPLRVQQVDASTHAAENSLTRLVSITQIALDTTLDAAAKHFCDQIWDVVRVILYGDLRLFEIPEQIRCIQHEQPKVAHRDAADTTNPFMGV
jgi:hypothetical protein